MAINIVSLISQFLTPDIIARLASMIGIDAGKAQSAIGGAIPGLLGGLLGAATQPGGPERLADAVNREASMVDSYAGHIGGGGTGADTLLESGGQLLNSLLGTNNQTALSSAVAKSAGIGQGDAASLLGALAPMVLGVIGKQAGPGGFEAGSLVTMLSSQKDNILSAMPRGMTDALRGSGVLDSITGAVGGAANAARGAASAASDTARRAASATAAEAAQYANTAKAAAGSGMNWLYWAIPVVLVAGLLWYFMAQPGGQRPATDQVITGTVPVVVISGVDVRRELDDGLGSLKTSLDGVTDAATAQSALPTIEAAASKIDTVANAFTRATAEQKSALLGMVGPTIASLAPTFDRVMAIPGVSEVLKPTVDTIRAKLATITG